MEAEAKGGCGEPEDTRNTVGFSSEKAGIESGDGDAGGRT